MKDEDKAKELADCCPNCTFSCGDRLNCKAKSTYNKLLQMAKWKEEQLIDKACETIKNLLSGYIIRNFHFGDSYDEDKLIEDFKQAMKG